MSSGLGDQRRRLIPRWRSKRATLLTRELEDVKCSSIGGRLIDDGTILRDKSAEWERHRDNLSAVELLSAAIILDHPIQAREAASWLRRRPSHPSGVSKLTGLFENEHLWDYGQPSSLDSMAAPLGQQSVRHLRKELAKTPRNAFLWMELARSYATIGILEKAQRATQVALALAPTDRYITRSSTRFFVHIGAPDYAHHLLLSNPRIREDPWLLSAEIATSNVIGKTSRLTKIARNLSCDEQIAVFHRSELNGALGTLELDAGAMKKARRHFSSSLADPTDNSVAQAVWTQDMGQVVVVENSLLEMPQVFEARTLSLVQQAQWSDALASCREWLVDEPFSSRPAEAGSYYAAVALGDFSSAEQFARQGLIANPSSQLLRNNLIVALLLQNKLEDASAEVQHLSYDPSDTEFDQATLLATTGLLAFRLGDPESGRSNYQKALQLASAKRDTNQAVLAAAHLAQEELVAGTDQFETAIAQARQLSHRANRPAAVEMISRLENMAREPRI